MSAACLLISSCLASIDSCLCRNLPIIYILIKEEGDDQFPREIGGCATHSLFNDIWRQFELIFRPLNGSRWPTDWQVSFTGLDGLFSWAEIVTNIYRGWRFTVVAVFGAWKCRSRLRNYPRKCLFAIQETNQKAEGPREQQRRKSRKGKRFSVRRLIAGPVWSLMRVVPSSLSHSPTLRPATVSVGLFVYS